MLQERHTIRGLIHFHKKSAWIPLWDPGRIDRLAVLHVAIVLALDTALSASAGDPAIVPVAAAATAPAFGVVDTDPLPVGHDLVRIELLDDAIAAARRIAHRGGERHRTSSQRTQPNDLPHRLSPLHSERETRSFHIRYHLFNQSSVSEGCPSHMMWL